MKKAAIIAMITAILILFLLLQGCLLSKPLQQAPPQQEQPENNSARECLADNDCTRAGCSGTLCIPKLKQQESGFTTCEFKPEYECYQQYNCICKENKCGWDKEELLNSCIKGRKL